MSDETYQVVARRFRPRRFDELVGQEGVVRSLRGVLTSGQVPHAFLFAGSRGVGKTTTARILARALNCEEGVGPDPCGVCTQCTTTLEGRNPDVVEIDAASHNLVDDIRDLRDRVGFASMGARTKVYILDEVHMLTRSAFNAFLKTLEEPPANVVFVLATTELHKVPDTIRSRCFTLDFRRIVEPEIQDRLKAIVERENVQIDDAVLEDIASSCKGGMRDAETALERVLALAREQGGSLDVESYRRIAQRVGHERVVEVLGGLLTGDARGALHFADEVVRSGVDEREALGELLEGLRQVLLLAVDGAESALVEAQGPARERLAKLASEHATQKLDAVLQAALLGRDRIRRSDDRRAVLELTLLRMAQAGDLPTLTDLLQAVQDGASLGAAAQARPVPGSGTGARPGGAGGLRGGFLAAIRQLKPMLVSTAEECELEGPDDDGIIGVRCASSRRIHRDRLASPEVRAMFVQALQTASGRELQVHWLEDAPSLDEAAAVDPSVALPDVVERVRKRFDGTVVDPGEILD